MSSHNLPYHIFYSLPIFTPPIPRIVGHASYIVLNSAKPPLRRLALAADACVIRKNNNSIFGIIIDADIVPEIGVPEIGVPEIGSREIGSREIGAPEIGAHEISAPEIGVREIGPPEIGAPEIGAPEIGSREIGIPEIGSREIGSREIGAPEIGSREIDFREIDVPEIGAPSRFIIPTKPDVSIPNRHAFLSCFVV
jgi:hypothetical protein